MRSRLRPGAAVLDLGCAAGVPVAAELAGRYRVTGVDISPEHVQQAARNVPDAEFVCSDALTVTFPAGHFDAIISLYTFDHIPRDEHRGLLERLRHWLRPDGLLLLSIEDLDEPGTVAEWLGVDMFFSMFGADATRQLDGTLDGSIGWSFLLTTSCTTYPLSTVFRLVRSPISPLFWSSYHPSAL